MIVLHRASRGETAEWHECEISDRSLVAHALRKETEFDDELGNSYRRIEETE